MLTVVEKPTHAPATSLQINWKATNSLFVLYIALAGDQQNGASGNRSGCKHTSMLSFVVCFMQSIHCAPVIGHHSEPLHPGDQVTVWSRIQDISLIKTVNTCC